MDRNNRQVSPVINIKNKSPAELPKADLSAIGVLEGIAELNKIHAMVMIGGSARIMNEVTEPSFGRPDVTFSSVADFRNFYANKTTRVEDEKGNSKVVPLADVWIKSPDRREYKGIVFSPGKDVPGYYNLYRGFAVAPQKGDWSLFRNHIVEVIAGGRRDIAEYLLSWMAHLVQSPGGERPGTSVVLRGPQGVGKGCFVSGFGPIFGGHFLHISNQNQLTGRFNSHLKDALLVFCDEGVWTGDRAAEGVLKAMITEKQVMVEPKGKDAFSVQNHIRLIVASNNRWVVPAGLEERRFFVLDVSDKRMRDRAYFSALYKQMDNGGREAMLYDLLEMDLSRTDLREYPRTSALLDQIVDSMNSARKFWYERLLSGSIMKDSEEWQELIQTQHIHQDYSAFAKDLGMKHIMTDRQLSKEIRKLCPGIHRHRPTVDGERCYCLSLPALEECRKSFEAIVRIKIDWDEETDV
ncbi:MAG: primase-helicase family protein [Syntrophobacteraceae bacterium]